MDIINVTCDDVQTPVGFLYVTQNQTLNPDCEQSWYSEDGRLLAHPSDPQTLMDPVISVSSDRLVTSRCVNLIHEIICDASGFRLKTIFTARNQTEVTPNPEDLNEVTPDLPDMIWWISVLIIILLVFICVLLRKRIFRCFQREEQFIYPCEAQGNGDAGI